MDKIKSKILKTISKMNKYDRASYYIGDAIFKKIFRDILPTRASIVELDASVMSRVITYEAMDLRYSFPSKLNNYLTPWNTYIHIVGEFNIVSNDDGKREYKRDDTKLIKMYHTMWSYYENYRQIESMLEFGPFDPQFHETIVIGLLHELRHIYQFESGMFGENICEISSCPSNIIQKCEDDAVAFGDKKYKENESIINKICEDNCAMYLNMMGSNVFNLNEMANVYQ
jgi:hypothetical protein